MQLTTEEIKQNYHVNLLITYLSHFFNVKEIEVEKKLAYFFNEAKLCKDSKIFWFKKRDLPRINIVKKYINYRFGGNVNHLDVGFGRGTSLFELWGMGNGFPYNTYAIDEDEFVVKELDCLNSWTRHLTTGNICDNCFSDNEFHITTCLEVLEHIEHWELALNEMIRVTSHLLILSVPSKEDNNPEHINLFNTKIFSNFIIGKNINSIKFEFVNNHIIVIIEL